MRVVAIFLLMLSVSGCSTLINGTDQVVVIDNYYSEKAALKVHTPYKDYMDTMPAHLYVGGGSQAGGVTVQVQEQCYDAQKIQIPKDLRGSYWLNVFNIFGFFVDYGTGAMWEYPEKLYVPIARDEQCLKSLASEG